MNIFNRVTIQSLRKNKTRTIVTIIGIILSTALICAVITASFSFINYARNYVIDQSGRWHGCFTETDYHSFIDVTDDEKISEYTGLKEVGYAEIGSKNKYKPYLYVVALTGSNDNIVSVKVTSGNYPQTSDEILLPEHLSENGGVTYNIGDSIELEIGDRICDGNKIHQNTPIYESRYINGQYTEKFLEEEFVPKITRTYTVSGFYKRPEFEGYSASGYSAIVLDDGYDNDTVYDIYFTMKNPKQTRNFMNSHELNGNKNYDLLTFYGATGFDGLNAAYYSMLAILIGLIMFGSISLIYNAFSISVSERTKQFGLLSSIGATKKQLRKMVLSEALTVSIIGIPSGIIVGIVGISITLMAIGNKISSVLGIDTPMKICISPVPILTACAIALLTVLTSAWIPSRRATRITAVEAIRQNRDIKSKNKPIKTPKIVYRLFGMPGMLAQKYFRRNKKKYRATIMSLFMSIVLFISASAFSEYIMATIETPLGVSSEYDLTYYFNNYLDIDGEYSEKVSVEETVDIIKSAEDVTGVTYIGQNTIFGKTEEKYLTEEALEIKDYLKSYSTLYFMDDDSFRELLKENNLDEDKFMNPENPLAVAVDGGKIFDYEQEKYVKLHLLASDECEITELNTIDMDGYYYDGQLEENGEIFYLYRNEDNPQDVKKIPESEVYTEGNTFRSGKTITNTPSWFKHTINFCFVYPYSMAEILTGNKPNTVDFYIKSDNHANSCNILKQNDNINEHNLNDVVAENEKDYNMLAIVKVFAYGFIILISLIACANVFNTISTNVNLRRRDFAMLRSVGMTNRELRKMTNFECIMYGTKALLFGLPVSFGMTVLIYLAIHKGFENDFFIPWKAVGIAIFSVFAVVFATMIYSMSKIKSDNLIETLKNENI